MFLYPSFPYLETLPYVFLILAVLGCLIFGPHRIVGVSLLAAAGSGLWLGQIQWVSLLVLILTPLSLWLWQEPILHGYFRWFFGLLGLAGLLLVLRHQVPGVENLKIFSNYSFSLHSGPYSSYLNFDKVFLGIGLFWITSRSVPGKAWSLVPTHFLKSFCFLVLTLLPLGLVSSYIAWEPKANGLILFWAINNFFFVCFSEEVLFRAFIQTKLIGLGKEWGYHPSRSILFASFVFGLAHFAGGWVYVLMATVAGFFYGSLYHKTGRLGASMALHFGLNLIHILLFTYPYQI